MPVDYQFNAINDKLQQLLRNYARLKKENEKLREEVAQHKQQQSLSRQLIEQMAILKSATGEMREKDKKDFERRLTQYIKEIDKCISFLSQ